MIVMVTIVSLLLGYVYFIGLPSEYTIFPFTGYTFGPLPPHPDSENASPNNTHVYATRQKTAIIIVLIRVIRLYDTRTNFCSDLKSGGISPFLPAADQLTSAT